MNNKTPKEYAALAIAAVTLGLLIYGVGTGKIEGQVVVDMIKPVMEWAGM